MNGLNWRTLWDLEMIERQRQDARLEWQRALRDAGVVPINMLAPLCLKLGGALIATGQRLAGEPTSYRSQTASVI